MEKARARHEWIVRKGRSRWSGVVFLSVGVAAVVLSVVLVVEALVVGGSGVVGGWYGLWSPSKEDKVKSCCRGCCCCC